MTHSTGWIAILLLLLPLQNLSWAVSPATRPTIVIVHGAWGGAWEFKKIDDLLTADAFKVYRPTLTGQGERAHLASPDVDLNTHINDICSVFAFEDLHDVLLVGHSYGGMVITGVADRIPDRIRGLVYIDALLPEDGESVDSVMPTTLPSNRKVVDGMILPGWRVPAEPPHDVPQSLKTFTTPISLKNPAREKIPATYILLTPAGKPIEQATFFKFYMRAKSRGWKTMTFASDHNVMLSHPKDLERMLLEIVGQGSDSVP